MTVDQVIAAFIAVGAANAEYVGPTDGMPRLLDGIIGQPPPVLTEAYTKSRKEVRDWHMSAPLAPFHEARRKFDAAGLNWFSGVNTIAADCDDEEIDAIFKQMAAMDLKIFCTNQTRVDTAAKMIAPAKKYGIKPAFHTHDKSEDPNEVASADSLVRLLRKPVEVVPHYLPNEPRRHRDCNRPFTVLAMADTRSSLARWKAAKALSNGDAWERARMRTTPSSIASAAPRPRNGKMG